MQWEKSFNLHLETFEGIAWVCIPYDKRKKLDVKNNSCIMMGYYEESKHYRLLDPIKQEIIYRRDAIFDKKTTIITMLKSFDRLLNIDPLEILLPTTQDCQLLYHNQLVIDVPQKSYPRVLKLLFNPLLKTSI